MSVFEDLIEELKEENLLEETVIDVRKDEPAAHASGSSQFSSPEVPARFEVPPPARPSVQVPAPWPVVAPPAPPAPPAPLAFEPTAVAAPEEEYYTGPIYAAEEIEEETPEPEIVVTAAVPEIVEPAAVAEIVEPVAAPEIIEQAAAAAVAAPPPAAPREPQKLHLVEKPAGMLNEREYFRKRAMDEVTGLQMVEHVLSGVEREQMKVAPKPYDDLPVKLALHDFLQDGHESSTTEHAQSEFKLMQETENWYSALSHRDRNISVAHLRRFCETTRPALSAQALIALSRFYRNSPYSEAVRSKFDLVLTRLFSRELEDEQRELLLEHDEMIQQLKELYADWSSIQLYAAAEDDSEIVISTMKFADFIKQAEETNSFEEFIGGDFFNRLRLFKEGLQENFFAPLVTVAAVEANVRIGNRYVQLLQKEKQNFSVETLEEKYGFLYDQTVSDATGKTYELVALLHERNAAARRGPAELVEVSVRQQERSHYARPAKAPRSRLFAVNKYLIALTVLTVLVCGGLYFWAEMETKEIRTSPNVKKVNLENSEFKDYIQTARIADETFLGVTLPSWESMNSDKKKEFLTKILTVGSDKNYKKVQLINSAGKSVGFASAEKIEVYNQ